MVVDVLQIEKAAKELQEIMHHVPEQIKRLQVEIQLCEQETQDLLHLIELSNFHASEGYRLSKDLQITRKKRRQFKDELDALKSIFDRTSTDRALSEQFNVLRGVIEHRKINVKARSYKPRIRTDLTEKFNRCKHK